MKGTVIELQVLDQVRENVADSRAKQCQNDDNDDCDQNQNQRVFYEALTFFTRDSWMFTFTCIFVMSGRL